VPDIGNTLREARIRRGLSITDVENVIKIRTKYLQALEENDFEVLPGPTVVKGFLRSYALFLKVDPDRLLYEYRSQYESRQEEVGPLRTEMTQQRRTQTSAERMKKRTRRTQRGYVTAAVVAIIIIIVIAYVGARQVGKGPAVLGEGNIQSTTSSATSTTVAVQTTSTSSTVPKNTTSTVAVATTTGENVTMVLTVTTGSCWLVVRQDNETGYELYAGTLTAGGQQTFDSAKRYWVRAGVPEALAIHVDGNPFSVTGEAGIFLVTETGVEREQSDSTTTTE
jgi:cytoskeleton protein RodZ